jgi:hypothetical protein
VSGGFLTLKEFLMAPWSLVVGEPLVVAWFLVREEVLVVGSAAIQALEMEDRYQEGFFVRVEDFHK